MRSIWKPAIHQTGAYAFNILFTHGVLWWGKVIITVMQQKVVYNYLLTNHRVHIVMPLPHPARIFSSWSEVLNRPKQIEKLNPAIPPHVKHTTMYIAYLMTLPHPDKCFPSESVSSKSKK